MKSQPMEGILEVTIATVGRCCVLGVKRATGAEITEKKGFLMLNKLKETIYKRRS